MAGGLSAFYLRRRTMPTLPISSRTTNWPPGRRHTATFSSSPLLSQGMCDSHNSSGTGCRSGPSTSEVTRPSLQHNAGIDYIASMSPAELATTTLTIRNVDRHLKERLRIRAAQHGQSMEAELRQILRDTLEETTVPEPNLAEAIRRRFAALGGVELEPHPPSPIGEPPSFKP